LASQQLIANANGFAATQGTALASYQLLQAHEALESYPKASSTRKVRSS
jgi:hypothetical protein